MANKSTSIEKFAESVRRFMRRTEMIIGGENVLLAVSGGIDSIVLLDVMARFAPALRLRINVAHFDHGLRESSAKDAEFVRDVCQQYGIKPFLGNANIRRMADEEGRSIEETARRERYAFLERIAKRHRFDLVMTGHTATDNAETLLMNLLRGSGVTGLAGIPPTRRLAGICLLGRPMLECTREEVEAYAEARKLKWREDESNNSIEFTRNRIRHELMPVLKQFNPNLTATLNTTAGLMRDFDRYLSTAVETAARNAVVGEPVQNERVVMDIRQLKHLQPAIRGEVIQRVMADTFSTLPLSYAAVERCLELLWKETGMRANLGGRFEGLRDRDNLVLMKNPPIVREVDKTFRPGQTVEAGEVMLVTSVMDRENVRFTSNPKIEFIDADNLPERLTIRSWREGDRFYPLGMKGEKKLSDFLIDTKVPLDRKRQVLVVTDGKQILWVCGMRMDERYRVGKETKRVLKMELRKL